MLKGKLSNMRAALAKMPAACFLMLALYQTGAQASLIVSIESATVAAGTSGNGLDIQLTNTGPADVTIGAFSLGINVGNSHIDFTSLTTATIAAPYIFGANSLFGPDLTVLTTGQSLTASDVYAIPLAGAPLSSGATVGLGHLLFDVAAGAGGGIFAVTLAPFPQTSAADDAANNLSLVLDTGQITIAGGPAVPEPATVLTILSGAIVLLCRRRFRRRSEKGMRILERNIP